MANLQKFIVGEKVPAWFTERAEMGRAKELYDEDTGELIGIRVTTATKTYDAKVGDTILLMRSGMVVVPKEKAEKYGLQRKVMNKEEE